MNDVRVNEWCKACGICAEFCPKKVFDFERGNPPVPRRVEDCIGWRLCELRCPDFAVMVEVKR